MRKLFEPRPTRAEVLQSRVSAEEWAAVERLAKKYCQGNVSEWIRHAALNFRPLPLRQKARKLKKRK